MGEWLVSTEGRRQCFLIGKKTKWMSYSSDRKLTPHKDLQRKNPQELVRISWGFNYETSNGADQWPSVSEVLLIRLLLPNGLV